MGISSDTIVLDPLILLKRTEPEYRTDSLYL